MDRRLLQNLKNAVANFKPELEDNFEDLPSRSPAAYAEAREKYRRMMKRAFRYAVFSNFKLSKSART